MEYLVATLLGYFIGALPIGLAVASWRGVDLTQFGSGNIGMTNLWRALGWKYALPVGIADVGKGAIPVLLCQHYLPEKPAAALVAGCLAIGGHIASVFVRKPNGKLFGGGKAVNTTLGVLVALLPVLAALGLTVFILCLLMTRMVSVSSTVAALTAAVAVFWLSDRLEIQLFMFLVTALIVFKHRTNYRRILKGEEAIVPGLPQFGAWPWWLIPNCVWARMRMLIWKPASHVVFMIHVIGEGDTAAKKGVAVRLPLLAPFIPKRLCRPLIRYMPYWMRYVRCARFPLKVGGKTRWSYVHVIGVPWNTTELIPSSSGAGAVPYHKAVEADLNQTILYVLRQLVPWTNSISLGAATSLPNRNSMELPGILEKAGLGRVIVTTGNSVTAKAAFLNIEAAHSQWRTAAPHRHGKKWRVGIVGAGGMVGSGLARLLQADSQICSELILVGRPGGDRKVADLMEILKESYREGAPEARTSCLDSALEAVDVLVLATNSSAELAIDPTKLRPGTFILDVAKPANVPRAVVDNPAYLVAAGSIVTLPGSGKGFGGSIGLPEGHLSYACGMEGVLIADIDAAYREGDIDCWSDLLGDAQGCVTKLFVGNPNPQVADNLGEAAKDRGILPCSFLLNPHTNEIIAENRVHHFFQVVAK